MVHFLEIEESGEFDRFLSFMYIQHLACRSTTACSKGADPGLHFSLTFCYGSLVHFNLPHGKRMCQLTRMQMFKCVFQP